MKLIAALLLISLSVTAADTGTLKGIFKYNGEPPEPKPLVIAKDKAGECEHGPRPDESLIVDPKTRSLKWGVVRIMGVHGEPPEPQKFIEISQEGCKFTPRVVLMTPGTDLDILNPDRMAHNAHMIPMDGTNIPFSRMLSALEPKQTIKGRKHLNEPEFIMLQCDIHPWMRGFIVIHDPRYAAITAEDGKFEIKNIPVGKYKVLFNHEVAEQEKEFEIRKDETTDAGEILFKLK